MANFSGAYFEDCNPVIVNRPNHVFDAALADRLWKETEAMVRDYIGTPLNGVPTS